MLTASAGAILALAALCAYAAAVDARTMRLPDATNAAIFALGLAASLALGRVPPLDGLLAAAAGGGLLLAVALAFRARRGVDGLGLGDVKLVAAAGPWVGLEGLAPMLLLGSIGALAFVAARRMRTGPVALAERLPFGPFLCAAIVLVAGLRWLAGATPADVLLGTPG